MQRDFVGAACDPVLMADDWDLHAVVRSCTVPAAIKAPEEAFSRLEDLVLEEEEQQEEKDHSFAFPILLKQTTSGFDELHQLCGPFLSKTTSINELETLNSPSVLMKQKEKEEEEEDKQKSQKQPDFDFSPTSQPQNPRTRRRKFQQERLVCQVTAENLSVDMWAWRKYGQKPIKGSQHPRNYYRCSSSKGCSARKQVERSTSDPNTFTITYTGEHTHPPPLHKNSLAGSTRNKIPAPATAVENEEESIKETGADETAFIEDDEDILIPNMAAMEDEIFLGLEELGYDGAGSGEKLTSSGGSWTSPPQFAGR